MDQQQKLSKKPTSKAKIEPKEIWSIHSILEMHLDCYRHLESIMQFRTVCESQGLFLFIGNKVQRVW